MTSGCRSSERRLPGPTGAGWAMEATKSSNSRTVAFIFAFVIGFGLRQRKKRTVRRNGAGG